MSQKVFAVPKRADVEFLDSLKIVNRSKVSRRVFTVPKCAGVKVFDDTVDESICVLESMPCF